MSGIIETKLGFELFMCGETLKKMGFDIPNNCYTGEIDSCNYWHYQLEHVFRVNVRNGQNNSVYVGTPEGIDYKKLGGVPQQWVVMVLELWNKEFSHLADKHGWVKVRIEW